MESVRRLGITFRNRSHMRWFVTTMGMTGFVACMTLVSLAFNEIDNIVCLLYFLGYLYVGVTYRAIYVTRLGSIETELFSTDCIWYNALLACTHLCAAYLISRFWAM